MSKDFKNKKASKSDADKLNKWRLDITRDAVATEVQRDQANADKRFVGVDGGMWEGPLFDNRFAKRIKGQFFKRIVFEIHGRQTRYGLCIHFHSFDIQNVFRSGGQE